MLQRQNQTPDRGAQRGAGGPAIQPDRQSLLGNSAVKERAAPVNEAATFPDGAELEQPGAHQPLRPTKLTVGQSGALIGASDTITLSRAENGKGRSAGKVADGAAAEILEVKGARIKVRVRSGKKNIEGWVDAAVFSDQPALTRDEDNEKLTDDLVYSKVEGDMSPTNPTGKDTAQGSAGDCFLIASMAAVANASPGAIKDMVKYNKGKGTYTVRFYEEEGRGKYKPVYIEVDAYLPTSKTDRKDPTYAGDAGGPMWSAIIEKAYAKWKGGYNVIGEGGTGEEALAEITGARSENKRPSSMKEAEVIPYFEKAKKDGKAIYAGVVDARAVDTQKPFTGRGDGPYKGKVTHTHRWNEIMPGRVQISDAKGKAGDVTDIGEEGDKTGKLEGTGLKTGSVAYKGDGKDALELSFNKGAGPAKAADLQIDFEYEGVLDVDRFIIGNHAYAFEGVVNGKELQFYNPWGTYQPKPITPAQFLQYFDSLSTNTPPARKAQS